MKLDSVDTSTLTLCMLFVYSTAVPLWYKNWLETIFTVMKYAPPQSDTPYFPDAQHFPLAPHNALSAPHRTPHPHRAPHPHSAPSVETNEIDIRTLSDERAKPNLLRKGTRYYMLNRMKELDTRDIPLKQQERGRKLVLRR